MRRRAPDLWVLGVFLALPVLWFNQVLWPGLSGKSLLPFDNLYAFEPWHGVRPDVVPYNPLVSDLVLESAVWELHARHSIMSGEVPLWNPQILAGAPFLADAQGSVLYPPDLVLYWLPLPEAFGWYTALHISLAGLGMFALCSVLGVSQPAALLAGVAFMFSGTVITNATFPQVLGASAWVPLLLAVGELIVRGGVSSDGRRDLKRLWFAGVGIVAMQFLAGHPEISMYALMTFGSYCLARLLSVARTSSRRQLALVAARLISLVVLGSALAAVQLLPTLEAVGNNARQGVRSAADLAAVAWPLPQLWTLLLPDLFGNPTHRAWLDIWSATWRATPPIFWGTKNYIEGGQYVGLLTWLLAGLGLIRGRRLPAAIFGTLGLVSLVLVLGSPLYLILQALPGFSQLRSPFRWILPFGVAVCVLAGLGMDVLVRKPAAARRLGMAALALAGVTLGAVGLSLVQPEPFLKLAQRFVTDPAWAERAFGSAGLQIPNVLPTPAMFWGYESQGLLRLGLVGLASGVLLLWARGTRWPALAIGLIALDLFSVHGTFLPAADVHLSPLMRANKPPVIAAIEAREQGGEPWRFTTFERGDEKTFLANGGMYYGWHDARGYDSIVPRWYAEYTRRLGLPINSLAFNRIAPVYNAASLDSTLLNLLNVKYVLTEQRIDDPGFVEIYRDAHIGAYLNTTALPRSFVAPLARVLPADQQPLERTDPRDVVYLETDPGADALSGSARGTSYVRHYGSGDVTLDVALDGPAWVVLADSWGPGWHATATGERGERVELNVFRAYMALRAVHLPTGGAWTVEFWYLPDSFRAGVAVSGATMLVLLALGLAPLVMSRRMAWAAGRSAPSRPLRAPYSPAGRGA
jgi:hypothetical protein